MVHESRKRGCAMRTRGPYIDRALIVRVPRDARPLVVGESATYQLPQVFEGTSEAVRIRPATVITINSDDTVLLRVHLPALP